jgi:hypothetical protein
MGSQRGQSMPWQEDAADTPATDAAGHCSFCGSTTGPVTKVEGLFTVLMCVDCQAARGYGAGPYPVMTSRSPIGAAPVAEHSPDPPGPPAHR